MQLNLILRLPMRILSLARISSIILQTERSDDEIAPGSPALDDVVPVDDLPVDLPVSIPPGDGGVGDSSGDAGQVDGILVPAPLVAHHLLFEGGGEFNLQKRKSSFKIYNNDILDSQYGSSSNLWWTFLIFRNYFRN